MIRPFGYSKNLLRSALKKLSRGRLPQYQGRLYLPGLREQVLIKRDRWGIPAIAAGSRRDLFFAQGFIHAQERLWQMEIHRRAAAGTISAVVGQAGLQTDRLSRTLGFRRLAQEAWALTSSQVQDDVLAYTAGINAFLGSNRPLPVEFSLLRHRPEPWTHLDSVAFARMMAWVLSHGFASKLTRARLIEKAGHEAAAELELDYPSENPVTLPDGIEFNLLEPDGMLRAAEGPFLRRNMEHVGRGSNAWVVAGRRTTTGFPILCNDMHLPISSPSLWYVTHLSYPAAAGRRALKVTGVSLPGVPYVMVGHNEDIAWGATVSFVDNEDLFVERFSSDDQRLYESDGDWRRSQIVDERIEVRGRKAHVERVTITHHGPIISRILETNGQALALASKALEPTNSFDGFAKLNEAADWDDFASAVHRIGSPSLNLFYADKAGNIGYYVTGRAPIRRSGTGQVPVPGWSGEHDWSGEVPFAEMPHALNPAAGILVNANNKPVGDDYGYFLGIAWRNGYRARRIQEFIEMRHKLSIQDMCQLQSDLVTIPGQELVNFLSATFREGCDDTDAQRCLDMLIDWNGHMDAESTGALLYKMLVAEITQSVLLPRLGTSLTFQYLGAGPDPGLYPYGETYSQWLPVLLRALRSEKSYWLPRGRERTRLLEECLANTYRELHDSNGGRLGTRTWGARHSIVFGHVLSSQRPLDAVFDNGPFVVGGDADTVCQMSVSDAGASNNIAPSFRQIIDTADWDASIAMHAPGQSGHLASPHYGDLCMSWLSGEYYRLNWSLEAVDATLETSMRLLPQIGQEANEGPVDRSE